LVQQGSVYQSIRCHCFATVQLKWAALKVGDSATGFFNDQHSSRRVPGIQIELPESVEAPARHITQIQRRRSGTPHTVGSQCDLMIEVNIGILVALMAGEAGTHERFGKLGNFRHMNWTIM